MPLKSKGIRRNTIYCRTFANCDKQISPSKNKIVCGKFVPTNTVLVPKVFKPKKDS